MENNNATLNSKTYNSDLDATIQVLRGDPAPVQAPAEPEPAAAEKQPVQGQDAADVEDAGEGSEGRVTLCSKTSNTEEEAYATHQEMIRVIEKLENVLVAKYGDIIFQVLQTAMVPPKKNELFDFDFLAAIVDELADNEKYDVSLEELLDASYIPQKKKSRLDLAFDNARKKVLSRDKGKTLVPVHDRLNLPSSQRFRLLNHSVNGRKTGILFSDNADTPPVPQGLLDVFATEIKESKQRTVTLKITDLFNKTGEKVRKYINVKEGELAAWEERMRFNMWLREACAQMTGIVEGEKSFFAVMEFEEATFDCEYVTYSSPYFSKIYGIIESGKDKLPGAKRGYKLYNNLVKTAALSLGQCPYETLVGITNKILDRGTKTDMELGEREELTAGDLTGVTTRITWKTLLEEEAEDTYRYLLTLSTNNRNTVLKRLCEKLFLGSERVKRGARKAALLDPTYCALVEDYNGPVFIKTDAPTWSVLQSTPIVIVHHGKKKRQG